MADFKLQDASPHENQRAAVTAQTATDYTAQQRYPAEPLLITCMCGTYASILSAAVTSEALVAEVNNYVARDGEGREPIGDPPPDDSVPPDDEDDEDDDE
jgi:hypothetical protein